MILLGIDPGLDGAIAMLAGDELFIADMPTLTIERNGAARRDVDLHALLGIFRDAAQRGAVAWVEQVGARPTDGSAQAFTFGKGYGAILMGLAACAVPVNYAAPAVWKRALSVTKEKDSSRARASELMPNHAGLWKLKKHDGRAEAALIAEYGRRKTT